VLPVDQIVRDQLAYKFGITQEKVFLAGSGSGQPLGVFTASPNGSDTDRDTSTCKYALITQTFEYTLDGIPVRSHIDLSRPPLQSVEWITYVDTAGVRQTLPEDT
jgi:hypothetical protein